VQGYLEKNGLLSDDEICNLWDRTLEEFSDSGAAQSVRMPNNLLRKVIASVNPSSPVVDEIGFFRSIFGVEST
jgi:hypothetical protein